MSKIFNRKKTNARPIDSLIKVRIETLETELDFNIQSSTTGKQLFEQVAKTIGLREVWFFSLQFKDVNNQVSWLDLNKSVNQLGNNLEFQLRAKFYPEYIANEVHQDITLRLFYLQVKEQILQDEILCPVDQAILLAACSLQISDGDYSGDLLNQGSFDVYRLLSRRVTSQYRLSEKDWKGKIIKAWIKLNGMTQREAMLNYLKICEELEMYGISYFNIRNKKGKDLYFGVFNMGLNVYESNDQLNPRLGFRFDEIKKISFSGKKCTVRFIDKQTNDFIFFVENVAINEQIIQICIENHELYLRRRQPETEEIIKLRQEIHEERLKEQEERLKKQEERLKEQEERLKKQEELQTNTEILQVQGLAKNVTEQLKGEELESDRAFGGEEQLQLINQPVKVEKNPATINSQRSLRKITVMPSIPESSIGSGDSDLYAPIRQFEPKRSMSWNACPQSYVRRIKPVRSSTVKPILRVNKFVQRSESKVSPLQNEVVQRSESHVPMTKWSAKPKDPPINRTGTSKWTSNNDERQSRAPLNNKWGVNVQEKLKAISQKLEEEQKLDVSANIGVLNENEITFGRNRRRTLSEIQSGNTKNRVKQFENL